MAETGTTPVSTSRRKPRGNLARLVSRFEVLDIKHGTHKKSRSSASWGPSAASDTSTHSRLKDGHDVDEQSSAGPDPFDGATDVMIDVCLSRASSCRWPSHMLHSNVEGGGGSGDDDDRQISPARALISRQKSVAERRKAFEAKYGTRNTELHNHVPGTAGRDGTYLPLETLVASSVDTSLGDQPTDHNNVEHSVHAENCLPEDETLSEHQSWTTSITEWPLAKETSWQTSEERNQISYSVEEDQSSPQKTVTSSFENKMSEPFLVINYNRSPGVAQDVRIDPNIPPNDYILEGSSSREPLLFTGQLEKLNPLKQSDIVRDFRDENMHIPHLSPHEQRPAQTQLPSRTVSPFVTDMNSQPLRDSTNRVSEQLERMPSFPGHDYVRNDGPRQAALPYFWERTRGKLLERPSNPRLIRKSVIPTSRTAGAFGAQRAQRSSITPSKTCGPGYLTVGSKPWTVRQNPSPLKDRIGLFKALSRNESEAQLPDRPKQAKSSIGRQTAGKVMEALRIFSLSKDKRQHGSSAGNVPKPADTLSPRIWGTSRLFRSDTSTSVAGTFSLAALSSSSKARFGHTRATSKSESPGEDGTPMRRFLHATLDEDADSVTTSHTRPIGTPQMTISNDCASPTDPAPRTARRRGIACNEMPQVYKAQCPLEQPKPVRGSDMRRLVSLCRDKVSKHMFWGESEGGKG